MIREAFLSKKYFINLRRVHNGLGAVCVLELLKLLIYTFSFASFYFALR
jgi:hypothetical protein